MPTLATVVLPRFPVLVHTRAQEHSEGMKREFYLLLGQEALRPGSVPARLLALSTTLAHEYGGLTTAQQDRIDQSLADGEDVIDELVFEVPTSVTGAIDQLETVLDEADEWCRQGSLLCLATPPDLIAYRRWYLGSFRSQVDGGAPEPWTGPLH